MKSLYIAPIFALIDCNNFFVSCERVFRPDLEGRPVVVLSSNDGCAIARSNEAKDLGIPMAAPAFQYRQLFKDHGVVQFSANFELYGDMSERITRLLAAITPRIEVYSIDESFLDIAKLDISDYTAWGRVVRERIWREIGLPVSIGIAPSKTLAKLASEQSKRDPELDGVLSFINLPPRLFAARLAQTPVSHVWGIGRRLAPKLRVEGVQTALDLATMSPKRAQQLMGISGRQLVAELNGTGCHSFEPIGKVRKSIGRGRTFGEDTNELSVLEAAIASLTASAVHRLRTEGLVARGASLYIMTNRFKPGFQTVSDSVAFEYPSADTGLIASRLIATLANLYQPGQSYHRAGMLLHDFLPADFVQTNLFDGELVNRAQKSRQRMAALDTINRRFGRRQLYFAAEDLSRSWRPKQNIRSPRYTSSWDDLPITRCGRL